MSSSHWVSFLDKVEVALEKDIFRCEQGGIFTGKVGRFFQQRIESQAKYLLLLVLTTWSDIIKTGSLDISVGRAAAVTVSKIFPLQYVS